MNDELTSHLKLQRDRIDALDAQLLALLNERARQALQIGDIKRARGAPVFNPQREQQIITQLQQINTGPLTDTHLATIWREIMAAMRALEKPIGVAFLGPAGTYSEQAAHTYFGQIVNSLPCPSIDEVFRLVETKASDYGVAPIENSTEGAVSSTLDRLLQSPLLISGEIAVAIQHNLLTAQRTLDGVTRVCAHPQALAQCQQWLSRHAPQLEQQAVASNAEAARLAAQQPAIAAIASERAAVHYGLHVTCPMIHDEPDNRTRFIVIGGAPPDPTGADQTSLIFSVKNTAGAVFKMLEPLARHGVSMSRFESRPAKSGRWEYYFFVDLEGHRTDPPVAAALSELEQRADFFKLLGSYPRRR